MNKTFPSLARAPIVEALIHWQARPQHPFAPDDLRRALETKLPEFAKCDPIQQLELNAVVSGQPDTQSTFQQQQSWIGFRLASADGRNVAQFLADGLIFSRTQPYENWQLFTAAARRVWQVYRDLGAPLEIQRLGVRFINQLSGATAETLDEFLCDPPTCPSNLPLKEFVYQSTFAVPDIPFEVRVIKLMQPPGPPQSSGLFLDCDVFTTRPLESDDEIEDALVKMRWLKNNFFFSLLKPEAIKALQ